MPDINQYSFQPKEIVTLLVKAAGLHEGRWWLVVNFGMSPGNFGPSDDQIAPGMIVAIQGLTIQRVTPELSPPPPANLTVDAAAVNPRPKTVRKN